VVEPGRVGEVGFCASGARASTCAVDIDVKGATAAPDAAEPEHVIAARRGRRVNDLAEIEAHHGPARKGAAGGHGHPGTSKRVVVQSEPARDGAIEKIR
jgi:hypothetical protein